MRICSNENLFEKRLEELKTEFLIPRKYHPKVIDAEFRKVRNLPGNNFTERRKKSLEKRPAKDKKTSRLAAPFNFSPFLPKISNVLEKHFNSMIFKKP